MPVFICCSQSRRANEYITCSRSDRFFANPLPFNETVWNETASFFKTPEITVQQLADARMARLATSKRTNPDLVGANAPRSLRSWPMGLPAP
jgi:hypothetical protein